MKISAIIPAAGSGSRFGKNTNKLLENINEIPVIIHTLRVISSINNINDIIICTSANLLEEIKNLIELYKISKIKKVILGGETRQDSVMNGLNLLDKDTDFVLIHDGARPLISSDVIEKSIDTAIQKGASIVAVPTKDTIKRVDKTTGQIIETLNREELWNVQTPQVFKYKEILEAHIRFMGQNLTDDSALIEKAGIPVFVVKGNYENIKITTKEDLEIAKTILGNPK